MHPKRSAAGLPSRPYGMRFNSPGWGGRENGNECGWQVFMAAPSRKHHRELINVRSDAHNLEGREGSADIKIFTRPREGAGLASAAAHIFISRGSVSSSSLESDRSLPSSYLRSECSCLIIQCNVP